jgi:hypothetical protein
MGSGPAATSADGRVRALAALYFGGHAAVDAGWWLVVATMGSIRGRFELDPAHHRVLDGFFVPDIVILGALSCLAAVGIHRRWRGGVVLAAVVTGGSAYVTLYLAGWVARGGHGWMGVAAMTIETALMVVLVVAVGRTS